MQGWVDKDFGLCGGGKLMAELHYAAGQLYNFIEGVELSIADLQLPLASASSTSA